LDLLGGKGRSLGRLASAGFPVPDGFHVTTDAYTAFVAANDMQQRVLELATPTVVNSRLSFDDAAASISALMTQGDIPDDVAASIASAYGELTVRAVAVRSSATAEDLPDLSFAGQQDTFLNVEGVQPVLDAVKQCWISLWNPRALSYRHQMGIEHDQIAMAVVVQELVAADVSGVLFTANPATGNRNEMIVNSSYGLGEAIVSGAVTPDSFVMDRDNLNVKEEAIGTKEEMIVVDGSRGTRSEQVPTDYRSQHSVTAEQLRRLAQMAVEVEKEFAGLPQDIEWLIADGEIRLLQARPITNLPPPPLEDVTWEPPEPSAYLGRSQLVEHIPDPVSTLFADLHMKRSLQHYWGLNLMRAGNHDYADTQPPASFVLQTTINGYAYRHLGEPPRTGRLPRRAPMLPQALVAQWRKVSRAAARRWSLFNVWFLWIPQWRYLTLPRYLRTVRAWGKLDPEKATTQQLWHGVRALSLADARYWYRGGVWNAFSLTRGTEFALHEFLQEHGDGRFSSGQFLSGLKSPAFDAHVSLWRVAQNIRNSPSLLDAAIAAPPRLLLERLRTHPDGAAVTAQIDRYLDDFGHQVFTLDFIEPSDAEEPENVARSLHALILQTDYDPIAGQRELRRKRQAAMRDARTAFTDKPGKDFRKLLRRARLYYPNRERAMFHMGYAWTVLRPFARELGQRLVDAGTLTEREDVFHLTSDELGRAIRALLVGDGLGEYRALTKERKQLRAAQRQLSPPMHVGKPPLWLKGNQTEEVSESSGDTMEGSPVSPGRVTAAASLILSPADFDAMRPGTILVCPTTTPAWTQLFPQAVGLVTDIGGILAHGSIVAREYGIPAVLGLGDATKRISAGQIITVDGDRGSVDLSGEG
jgi:pyruvate,water dikinase